MANKKHSFHITGITPKIKARAVYPLYTKPEGYTRDDSRNAFDRYHVIPTDDPVQLTRQVRDAIKRVRAKTGPQISSGEIAWAVLRNLGLPFTTKINTAIK